MTEDLYIIAITALLPLTAWMLVVQVNPYHALVIRGILGAVAALVYALFGAADVALTEALVGTMLSITLYAVAVRSSLSMRMGILDKTSHNTLPEATPTDTPPLEPSLALEPLRTALDQALNPYHLRLELVPYPNVPALQAALMAGEIHTTCMDSVQVITAESFLPEPPPPYHLQTRVQRLYDLMQTERLAAVASLTYVQPPPPSSSAPQSSQLRGPSLVKE